RWRDEVIFWTPAPRIDRPNRAGFGPPRAVGSPPLQPFPVESSRIRQSQGPKAAVDPWHAHVLIGEPVSTSPEHAIGIASRWKFNRLRRGAGRGRGRGRRRDRAGHAVRPLRRL